MPNWTDRQVFRNWQVTNILDYMLKKWQVVDLLQLRSIHHLQVKVVVNQGI